MILLKLFWAFFQIGLFSFGGGYAAMPLIQNQVVHTYGWLNMTEFADIITISQMTPGPIAINSATFVGTRIAGLMGAIIATLGCVLPSCVIVMLLALLYRKYKNLKYMKGILKSLQPAVVGLIAAAGISIIAHALWNGSLLSFHINSFDLIAAAVLSLCLFILRRFKINPIYVMLLAGVVGGVVYSLK
jgi:chromate transporter